MIPVKGHPNLFRDEKSGAIINKDNVAYEQYLLSKRKRDIDKNQINELKNEIEEIKIMIKELLEKQ